MFSKKFIFLSFTVGAVVFLSALTVQVSLTGALSPSDPSYVSIKAGDLIKGSSSAVYFFDGGRRWPFPTESIYKTWYPDFSRVIKITNQQLSNIQLGGNITVRPGTKLVRFVNDSGLSDSGRPYAVEPGGVLRNYDEIWDDAILLGPNWESNIINLHESLLANYVRGDDIRRSSRTEPIFHPDGTLINYAGNPTVYYIQGGKKRPIASGDAFAANRFRYEYIYTTSIVYPDGAPIVGTEASLINPTAKLPETTRCKWDVGGWNCKPSQTTTFTEGLNPDATLIDKLFKNACEAQGGQYRCFGFCAENYARNCQLPFHDGGKLCTDSSQCSSGFCEPADSSCTSNCTGQCTTYLAQCNDAEKPKVVNGTVQTYVGPICD